VPERHAGPPIDWRRAADRPRAAAHLFAYGTLERPAVLYGVTGLATGPLAARLPGYRCFRLPGRPYPGIVACRGASTPGSLYLDLPPVAIDLLDRWEDDFYERRAVEVELPGRRTCRAFAYVVPAHRTELITDVVWRRMR
jgi:gamma-glutamylcyclotransferase (GGCT)/AIG2-like uncharacterized protein YtfP